MIARVRPERQPFVTMLQVTGTDSANFLQGLLTNDMTLLDGPMDAMYSLVLNVQVRYFHTDTLEQHNANKLERFTLFFLGGGGIRMTGRFCRACVSFKTDSQTIDKVADDETHCQNCKHDCSRCPVCREEFCMTEVAVLFAGKSFV